MALTDDVPSDDFLVHSENMKNTTLFMESTADTFTNRPAPNGVTETTTIKGMDNNINQFVADADSDYNEVINNAGSDNIPQSVDLPAPDVYLPLGNKIADTVSGGYSFTRSTSRGNINKSGQYEEVGIDEIAITENGASIYQSYTNLLTWTEDFTQASWLKGSTTITPANTEIFGLSATLIDGSSLNQEEIEDSAEAEYCISFFAKKETSDRVYFGVYSEDLGEWILNANTNFYDLSDGEDHYISQIFTKPEGVEELTVYFFRANSDYGATDVNITAAQLTKTSALMPYSKREGSGFETGGDLLTIPMMDNLPPSGDSWTISANCSVPFTKDSAAFIWSLNPILSTALIYLRRVSSGLIQFYYDRSNGVDRAISASGIDDSNHIFTCVYKKDFGMYFYIDGGLVGTNYALPNDVSLFDFGGLIYIGTGTGGGSKINSEISDFKIWHEALTAAQIYRLGGCN